MVLSFLSGCGSAPTPHASKLPEQIRWEPLARWSGKGDQQLDSFQSDSGALRIEWEAKAIAGAPTTDTFKVVVHSSISGRPLAAAVIDHRGEGKGTAYFSEEPRVFFLNVTSPGMEWKIAVSERVR